LIEKSSFPKNDNFVFSNAQDGIYFHESHISSVGLARSKPNLK